MPGLPMFGHGQVEGFTEKYGMEYRRAYWDEQPDPELVARHEREIFPLLHRRALFAEVDDFLLYDFFTTDGAVNEDVFAYSNRRGGERALVVYHNRYARHAGLDPHVVRLRGEDGAGDRHLVQAHAGRGPGRLGRGHDVFLVCRDAVTGLEHLHRSRTVAERVCASCWTAYACHVFLDWREVVDDGRTPGPRWPTGWAAAACRASTRRCSCSCSSPCTRRLRALLDPALIASLASGREPHARRSPPRRRPPASPARVPRGGGDAGPTQPGRDGRRVRGDIEQRRERVPGAARRRRWRLPRWKPASHPRGLDGRARS